MVEGDPAVRDSLMTLLGLGDYEVAGFATGQAFLDASGGQHVDCVICAADLPDISGHEVCRAFKSAHPETRFALLVSGRDGALPGPGPDAVFRKPLVSHRLRQFVAGPGIR